MCAERVLLSWSSGKDSAWALQLLRQDPAFEVVGLLTTVNTEFDRVAMHAVRRRLLQRQIEATGLEPWIVEIPHRASNEQYEQALAQSIGRAQRQGIAAMAFGDLYLEDVRAFRELQLADSGLTPLFPLWNLDTERLAQDMQAAGLRARVTCVDPSSLDRSFAGREWDAAFVADLPAGVDPCGENGEFHTFAYAGPMFASPVDTTPGAIVERDGFVFADLLAS